MNDLEYTITFGTCTQCGVDLDEREKAYDAQNRLICYGCYDLRRDYDA